ncbi:unnamed protein product [Pleuronectes platessa]|uniref:Uncharacterized protein n=1 Tax=Pleuronectes platessa TaxID=8262 RepID=A0A9N7VTZ1_PLEPL|nr:unnamed protein product [Pleuronectes platessa]
MGHCPRLQCLYPISECLEQLPSCEKGRLSTRCTLHINKCHKEFAEPATDTQRLQPPSSPPHSELIPVSEGSIMCLTYTLFHPHHHPPFASIGLRGGDEDRPD